MGWFGAARWILRSMWQAHAPAPVRLCMYLVLASAVVQLLDLCCRAAQRMIGGRLQTVPAWALEWASLAGFVALVVWLVAVRIKPGLLLHSMRRRVGTGSGS